MRHPAQLQGDIFNDRLNLCLGIIERAATVAILNSSILFNVDFWNRSTFPAASLKPSKYNTKVIEAALEEAKHAGYIVDPSVAADPDFNGLVYFTLPDGVL